MAIIDEIRISQFRDKKEEKKDNLIDTELECALNDIYYLTDILDDVTTSLSNIADFVKRPASTKRDVVHLIKSLENQINNRRGIKK